MVTTHDHKELHKQAMQSIKQAGLIMLYAPEPRDGLTSRRSSTIMAIGIAHAASAGATSARQHQHHIKLCQQQVLGVLLASNRLAMLRNR